MSALDDARSQLESWYSGLEPREQLLVRAGALTAAALVLLGVILQLHGLVNRAEKRVAAARADLAYIQAALPELRALPQPQGAGQSLVTVVDRTTRDAGIAMNLRGADPGGPGSVRVRFEGAAFDQLLPWLLKIEREYGLAVQAATLERTDAQGRVNAAFTLVAG
jgi:general secretion pathway protein M